MSNTNTGWRGKLKLLIFSLIPALVLFVIASVTSDLILHRTPETVKDRATGLTYYTMQIGRFPWSPRSVTPLNSMGFPDDEFTHIDKGSCVHVVFSGDSFTFGDSVDREKNYVSLVREATMRRYPDRCIRFFNIAERMTTIDRQTRRIRETMPLLQPDIVILGQYQNDLWDLTNPGSVAHRPPTAEEPTNHWGEVIRRQIPLMDHPIVRLLSYHTFAFMVQNNVHYDAPLKAWSVLADSSQLETAEWLTGIYHDLYGSLVEELRAQGIEFGVVIFPSKLDVLAGRYPEEEFFLSLAREHQVPHLSLFPALNDARQPYPWQMYDGHMNEHGNAIAAELVERWLFDQEDPPFPTLHQAVTAGRAPALRHTAAPSSARPVTDHSERTPAG